MIDLYHQESSEFFSFILIKPFMYMRNNKGPKMELCGMPYLIFLTSHLSLMMAFEPIKGYSSDVIMV